MYHTLHSPLLVCEQHRNSRAAGFTSLAFDDGSFGRCVTYLPALDAARRACEGAAADQASPKAGRVVERGNDSKLNPNTTNVSHSAANTWGTVQSRMLSAQTLPATTPLLICRCQQPPAPQTPSPHHTHAPCVTSGSQPPVPQASSTTAHSGSLQRGDVSKAQANLRLTQQHPHARHCLHCCCCYCL